MQAVTTRLHHSAPAEETDIETLGPLGWALPTKCHVSPRTGQGRAIFQVTDCISQQPAFANVRPHWPHLKGIVKRGREPCVPGGLGPSDPQDRQGQFCRELIRKLGRVPQRAGIQRDRKGPGQRTALTESTEPPHPVLPPPLPIQAQRALLPPSQKLLTRRSSESSGTDFSPLRGMMETLRMMTMFMEVTQGLVLGQTCLYLQYELAS